MGISSVTTVMAGFSKSGHLFLPQMPQSRPWVKQQHARPGISHHVPYFSFHIGAIAMNGALLARALPFSEFATVQSSVCIFEEFFAVVAELLVALFVSAINAYHLRHGLLFSFDACHAVSRVCLRASGERAYNLSEAFCAFHRANQRMEISTASAPTV